MLDYCRHITDAVKVGAVTLGGGAPIVVQSMTNTDTANIDATVEQIKLLSDGHKTLVINKRKSGIDGNVEYCQAGAHNEDRIHATEIIKILHERNINSVLVEGGADTLNTFIEAGLWTAYDHTGDGVSDMTLKYAKRGSGILTGTYSQGPVTGLDVRSKRMLGTAYDRALRDSVGCSG